MKFSLAATLMGIAATAVSAQDKQDGPFALRVKGTNEHSKIKGYGYSCHAGAAIAGLCYSNQTISKPNISNTFTYYFNYTGFTQAGDDEAGTLIWKQPYTDQDGNPASVDEPMGLVYQPTSNVAAPLFAYAQDVFLVGFDNKGELFGYNYVDDTKFAPGQPPSDYTGKAYYHWAVCWQYFTGYYYQSVAWVQVGAPRNPTCEPVEITKVKV
ncbi:hypothetical protein F4802DRAFT_360550 [Xylaria palmicola]|nr:hypothetical protein F4802DRAFT_360550 [Xylaria palmicola]